jgi:hypothetical protein
MEKILYHPPENQHTGVRIPYVKDKQMGNNSPPAAA